MTKTAPGSRLQGMQVAFAGKLASLSRAEAARLVDQHGGQCVSAVSRKTSLVVVGQEGWPLHTDGNLNRSLQKAQQLQQRGAAIDILPESEWLNLLGIEQPQPAVCRSYTTTRLSRILGVPGSELRHWVEHGFIRPCEVDQGVYHFDYVQATNAKTIATLIAAGASPAQIARSLDQLKDWLGELSEPLEQLALVQQDGELLIRLQQGSLAEPTGQLRFDFDSADQDGVGNSSMSSSTDLEHWIDRARRFEEEEQWDDAIRLYRDALLAHGPDPKISFDLANALVQAGYQRQALERFWQVVEMDSNYAEAWNNLGNLLADLQEYEEAIFALSRALEANSDYADAHYNLADVLEESGHLIEARYHWKQYVNRIPKGPEADYARRRLSLGG